MHNVGMRVGAVSVRDNFGYRPTQKPRPSRQHAGQMACELSAREQVLRSLPLPYSLALRLCDAGVGPEVVCEYLDVEQDALAGIYRMAGAKLRRSSGQAAADKRSPTPREKHPPGPRTG
jgi:hypothetical protein